MDCFIPFPIQDFPASSLHVKLWVTLLVCNTDNAVCSNEQFCQCLAGFSTAMAFEIRNFSSLWHYSETSLEQPSLERPPCMERPYSIFFIYLRKFISYHWIPYKLNEVSLYFSQVRNAASAKPWQNFQRAWCQSRITGYSRQSRQRIHWRRTHGWLCKKLSPLQNTKLGM